MKPYTWTTGTVIIASEHNSNWDSLASIFNGGIDNINISGSAAIAYAKLNLTNNILNSDINSSAAIADTKLATISTAGKVNASALTSLSSTPAGAGLLPVANSQTIDTLLPAQGSASGKFLTSNGANSSWGTVTPAKWQLISTTTISGAANSTDISITDGHNYKVVFYLYGPGSVAYLKLQFNGTSEGQSSYRTGGIGVTGGDTYGYDASHCRIYVGSGNNSIRFTGSFELMSLFNGGNNVPTVFGTTNTHYNSTQYYYTEHRGFYNGTVSTFRVASGAGETFTGTIWLYEMSQ